MGYSKMFIGRLIKVNQPVGYVKRKRDQRRHIWYFKPFQSNDLSWFAYFINHLRRSSSLQIFSKIGVLKNFAIFTRKHLFCSLFLIKLQPFRPATLFKKDFNTSVFLWILRFFLRTAAYKTPLTGASDNIKMFQMNQYNNLSSH